LENFLDKEFELKYFDMSKHGNASPTTMLALIEETAAEHCYAINHSLYDLEKQNKGWVLLSGFVQMDRYPEYKEKIVIRTWMSEFSNIKGFRENYIYDERSNIIGRAKGLWVFFDIEKRRPVQIFEDIKNKWSFCPEECTSQDITKKIEALDNAGSMQEYHVMRFDTDMNKHVNNIRYLQWVIESIPEEIVNHYFLYSINGRFISEAQLGDTIISLTTPGEIENSFVHTIRIKGSNRVCATAKTIWKKTVL